MSGDTGNECGHIMRSIAKIEDSAAVLERGRHAFVFASAQLEHDVRLKDLTTDEQDWLVRAILDAADYVGLAEAVRISRQAFRTLEEMANLEHVKDTAVAPRSRLRTRNGKTLLMANQVVWLLEWPRSKYMPPRYFAAGEPQPVLDPNDATRFAREEDAWEVGKAMHLAPSTTIPDACRPIEHAWTDHVPAPRERGQ